MSVAEDKSEEKDIKTPVLDRKIDCLSLFCEKLINFVRACINVAKCNIVNTTRIFKNIHYAVLQNKRSQSPSLEQL